MNGFSRTALGVVLVVVLIGTGLGVGGALAEEHVSVEQDNGTLEVTVNQTAFGVDDPSNATIDVDINGTEFTRDEEPTRHRDSENVYELNLEGDDSLADQNLSSVSVTVQPEAGNETTVHNRDLSLDPSEDSTDTSTNRGLSPDGRTVGVNGNLSGSGETNVTVFDAGADERLAQLDAVPYRNGRVLFGEAGYELTNASYVLLFEPDNGEPFATRIDAGDDDATVAAIGGGGGGILSDHGLAVALAGVLSVLVVVLVGGIYVVGGRSRSSDGRPSVGSGGRGRSMELDVYVVDKVYDDLIDKPVDVEFRPTGRSGGNRSVQRRVTGQGTVELPRGRYKVSFASRKSKATHHVAPDDEHVRLTVGPRYHQVTVQEAGSGGEIPAATVELSFPDGRTERDTTDSDGGAGFEIPRTVDAQRCELSVDHDRYRSTTAGLTDTVALEPLTGSARIDARLDGDPAPDVDVVLKPDADDGYTQRLGEPVTAATDADGTATFDDLPVGTYVAYIDFDATPTVETTPVSVDVTGEEQVTETIDAEFTFELDDDQRMRIEALYDDIEDLTPSNRDGAVPYYYGDVLSSVLSTVEEFEDASAAFLRHGVDPDNATDATIAAVDDAVAYTHTAMTNKQNVDLFSACRGLRDASVKWDGDVTVADLVAVLGDGKANHRQEMITRLESVGALLDDKQDEVSTVTPARDQYEQVREHATGLQDRSPVEQRAHFFVGLQLLDAIESTFDQPELVARLEETVF